MSTDLAPAPPATTAWLRVKTAAEHADVGPRTIYKEVAAGRLKAAKVGGRRELRFKREWIDAWLEKTATEAAG